MTTRTGGRAVDRLMSGAFRDKKLVLVNLTRLARWTDGPYCLFVKTLIKSNNCMSCCLGAQCDEAGCPGWPENCMGHGTCNAANGECTCDQGWKGVACHIPDCDCNGVNATCEQREGDEKPRCYDCDSPYIGDKCQYRLVSLCLH